MSPVHWHICELTLSEGHVQIGDPVGEVLAEDGRGRLTVFDEEFREVLEELFTQEQVAIVGREIEEDGALERTIGRFLEPWQPETLQYVRGQLGQYRLTAVEAPTPA